MCLILLSILKDMKSAPNATLALNNFKEKIQAICEDPIIFSIYPVTEETVSLFRNI
jgi:hypothetical protein